MIRKLHRAPGLVWAMVIIFSFSLTASSTIGAADWGVDTAVPPIDRWLPLHAGESHWYAFQYAGDGSQVEIRLQVQQAGSTPSATGVGFVVWTPELIEHWALGQQVEPVGRGSGDPFTQGTLVWSGAFTTAGTYYAVVEHVEGQPGTSYYLLQIEGGGVSFPASEAAGTKSPATPSPARIQSRSSPAPEPEGKLVFQTAFGGIFYTITLKGTGYVDGTDLQPVTQGIDPVWSPQGDRIAFTRWADPRGVWVVDITSGNEWRAFDWSETRHPSWSPDGHEIVFSRQRSSGGGGGTPGKGGRVSTFKGRPKGGSGGSSSSGATLGIVSARDGTFWEPQPVSGTNLTPDWSPDGEQIVFAGHNGLIVQSVDGAESWQLTTRAYDITPAWSPGGTEVAFVRQQHDHWEVYAINVTTGQQTRLTHTPDLNGMAAHSVSPAWSPDGKYIAFLTNRSGPWEIWIMESDGSSARPLFDGELDGLTLAYAFAGERAIDWTK